jgi:T5SS/PEP-CTERM-associated repeat protein
MAAFARGDGNSSFVVVRIRSLCRGRREIAFLKTATSKKEPILVKPHLHFAHRHAMVRLSRRIALALVFACTAAGMASATTQNWTGTTSTDWSTTSNWSGNAVPGLGDSVNIDTIAPNPTYLGNGATTLKLGPVILGSVTNSKSGLTISAASHLVATSFQVSEVPSTTGSVGISGNGSLTVSNDIYIGNQGVGLLNIGDSSSGPGTVRNSNGWVGMNSGSVGTVNVLGTNSTWANTFALNVGIWGTGVLNITRGASVTDATALIAGKAVVGSTSSVVVSDPGSNWTTAGSLIVGNLGAGQMQVENGASATSSGSFVGESGGGTGLVAIDGAGSNWTDLGVMTIGDTGSGNLGVTNGGTASAARAVLGNAITATGNVLVDSGASFKVTSDLMIAQKGQASVTLSSGGTLTVSGMPYLGTDSGTGSLNIGNGASSFGVGLTPKAPGVLNVPGTKVTLGSATNGSGVLVFNHTSANYVFAPSLADLGGSTPGNTHATIEVLAGSTSMTGDSSGYTGGAAIFGGTLLLNGKLGSGTVLVSKGGTLGGSGVIAGPVMVDSGGTVAPGNSPGTLTIGPLLMGTGSALDYDLGAPGTIGGGVNDLLVVNGNITLNGTLNIANAGGFAAGTYRLINYTGTLTGGSLSIGSVPAGFNAAQMKFDTSTPGQVNLIVSGGAPATPTMTITPSPLSWTNVPSGGDGGVLSATLTNTGTVPVVINSTTSTAAPFVASGGTCAAPPFTLAVGANCTFAYDFKPTAKGTFSSTITVASNAPAGPTGFLLSGSAVTAAAPALGIAPTNLSWSNVTAGSSGGVKTATLTNTGTATLTVNSISAPATPFSVSGGGSCVTPPFTLAVGASCTLAYDFDPTSAGTFSTSINVASDAPAGTQALGLNGTAVPPTLPPPPPPAVAVPAPMMSVPMLFVLGLMLAGCGAGYGKRRKV